MAELFCTPWLRFRLRDTGYAVPLDAVAEVTGARRPRLAPFVPIELGGVVNVRGEPLVVVNGGALLLGAPAPLGRHAFVLQSGAVRLGVLVDQVTRIERGLGGTAPELCPPPVGAPDLAWVRWVARRAARVGLLDPDALVERATDLLTGHGLQGEDQCQDAC